MTSRRLLTALFAALMTIGLAGSASAELRSGSPREGNPDGTITLTGTGSGQTVSGFFDENYDINDGYPPPDYDPTGLEPDSGFAGTLLAEDDSGTTTEMYCIDIRTPTYIGLSYRLGTWEESEVPNVGYVARILNDYYPSTGEPADAPNDNIRGAAVQAAIWFFTDHYLLAPDSPIFPYTAAIVNRVLDVGPLPEPSEPTLEITGPETGSAGEVVGPFTVNTSAAEAVLEATGATMYTDASATTEIPDGTAVPAGTTFYIRSEEPSEVELRARAELSTPAGSVFLYLPADPDDPDPADAQKLILAKQETVEATTVATVTIEEPTPTPTPTPTVTPTTVAPTEPPLPVTGGSFGMLLVAGGGLLAVGVLMSWLARARRRG